MLPFPRPDPDPPSLRRHCVKACFCFIFFIFLFAEAQPQALWGKPSCLLRLETFLMFSLNRGHFSSFFTCLNCPRATFHQMCNIQTAIWFPFAHFDTFQDSETPHDGKWTLYSTFLVSRLLKALFRHLTHIHTLTAEADMQRADSDHQAAIQDFLNPSSSFRQLSFEIIIERQQCHNVQSVFMHHSEIVFVKQVPDWRAETDFWTWHQLVLSKFRSRQAASLWRFSPIREFKYRNNSGRQ